MVCNTNFLMIDGLKDDFVSILDNDIGETITYTPVTTTQIGDGTLRTEGTPTIRTAFMFLSNRNYESLPEGFFENSDAVLLGKATDTWTRDSIVSYGGKTYKIKNVNDFILTGGLIVYKKIDLILMG